MVLKIIFTTALVLATVGCSVYHKELDGNPPFDAHQFRYYDLEINWRAERNDDVVRLAGTVSNLRSDYLWNLEVIARLMDQQGKVFARRIYDDFPTYFPPGKAEPFRLEFRLAPGAHLERIHFSYSYWPIEAPPSFRGEKDAPSFGSFYSPP